MKCVTKIAGWLFAVCSTYSMATAAQAQVYKLHGPEVTFSGVGQYTNPVAPGNNGIRQGPDNSFGGLITFSERPVAWAGVEANYSYTDTTEYFIASSYYAPIKTDIHEATAAVILHPHFRKLQPFVNIGGGAIDFDPAITGANQWRGAGLVEVGFDVPTSNPNFGFRFQGRALIYRAPNFYNTRISSKDWDVTSEPSFGAWFRFGGK